MSWKMKYMVVPRPKFNFILSCFFNQFRNRGVQNQLDITRKILISLPNIDVEGSIEYLISQGGESDWDVLIDVARIR